MAKNLREQLAALAHQQWAGWTKHMLDNMDTVHVEGWRRQIATPYSGLSEAERESDRKEADRVMQVFQAWLYDAGFRAEPDRPEGGAVDEH